MVSQNKCSKQSFKTGFHFSINNEYCTFHPVFFSSEACADIQNIKQIHVTWLCNKMFAYIVCTMYPSYFTEAKFLALIAKKKKAVTVTN